MSPDPVATFRPAPLPTPRAVTDGTVDRARAAGYAAGWAAGARAAAEAAAEQQRRLAEEHAHGEATRNAVVGQALSVLERAVAAASARSAPAVEEARRTLHLSAVLLAEVILRHELAPGPGTARTLLDRALAAPVDLGVHTIRLHPVDHAHVQAVLRVGSATLPDGVALVADASLQPGDVISEHPTGFLDGQLSTALDRARQALTEDDA